MDPIASPDICWDRKRKRRKDEYSCFVEVFPFFSQPEQIWFRVINQLRIGCLDEVHDLASLRYFSGGGGEIV